MSKSYILLTAMPPTTGHLQLIQFANRIAGSDGTVVIICTQPHEPFPHERVAALRSAVINRNLSHVKIEHLHKTIEQNPTAPGFWDMWRQLLVDYGIKPGDYIVASEIYGQKLAEITNTRFLPYDIDRVLNATKATPVRDDPIANFANILPEFQPYLRTTVTIFGAESTGKTTLSRRLAKELQATWLYEYARPYLEHTINEITVDSMTDIWNGQAALQKQVDDLAPTPYVVQDTDLFSTVGYWQFPHWQPRIGDCPDGLIADANALKSDLYIITKSNIPFEPDPLRYGGDKREGSDEYWIDICKQYKLPYIELTESDFDARACKALKAIRKVAAKKAARMFYDRHGL